VLATERVAVVLAGIGCLALALLALALVTRWPPLVAWAVAACGADYGLYLGLREQVVDRWAPLVAAALFLAAELGFRLVEPREPVPQREVVVRTTFWLAAGILAAATLAAVLLAAAGGGRAGLTLEAVGAAAAVVVVTLVVAVASRATRSS
jgi:hypothetical protein